MPSTVRPTVIETFRGEAAQCLAFGSPFNAALLAAAADSLTRPGPLAEILSGLTDDAMPSALPFRVAGALHAAVLSGQDGVLAERYPSAGKPVDGAAAWTAAEAFIARDPAWMKEWLQSPPQTNEVARSPALLAGVLTVAGRYGLPLRLFELGASAGLNLNLDRFQYRLNGWSWGTESSVRLDMPWFGGAPAYLGSIDVRERAGCDQNPLDVTDLRDRLRLCAYVWPDQPERLARLRAAIDLAARHGTAIEKADAGDWIERRLARRASGRATLVYHSIFYHYPPRATRARIAAAMESAGLAATNDAPLAQLRFEFEAGLGGPAGSQRCVLDLTTWPGGERRILADVDSHGRYVRWLGDQPARAARGDSRDPGP